MYGRVLSSIGLCLTADEWESIVIIWFQCRELCQLWAKRSQRRVSPSMITYSETLAHDWIWFWPVQRVRNEQPVTNNY